MKTLTLSLATLLALNSMSCSTVQSLRDKLENMSEPTFNAVVASISDVATRGGKALKTQVSEQDAANIKLVMLIVAQGIENDKIENLNEILHALIKGEVKFVNNPDLNKQLNEAMRDAIDLIGALVGNLDLGLDGVLSVREKLLFTTLFRSVVVGLDS